MGARGRWLRERRGPRSAGLASGSSRPRRAESFRRLVDSETHGLRRALPGPVLVPSDVAGQNVRSLHRVRVNRPPPVGCPSRGERGERGRGVSLLQVPSLLREGRAARLHQMSFKRVLSFRAIGGWGVGGGPQIFTSHSHFIFLIPSLSPKSAFRQRPSARLAPPNARVGAFPGASRSWSVRPFGAASRARRKEPGRCLLSAFRTGAARRSEGDVERSPALHASPPFPFA